MNSRSKPSSLPSPSASSSSSDASLAASASSSTNCATRLTMAPANTSSVLWVKYQIFKILARFSACKALLNASGLLVHVGRHAPGTDDSATLGSEEKDTAEVRILVQSPPRSVHTVFAMERQNTFRHDNCDRQQCHDGRNIL